jgi:hypothetical protein
MIILTEYSAACCVGSMLLQNLYPKGQNSVIPRPLAAGIGILKVLPVYFDLETDRINAPNRPLPSGHALPKDAILFTLLTAILGLAAAAMIGLAALVVALVLWMIGLLPGFYVTKSWKTTFFAKSNAPNYFLPLIWPKSP